MLKKWLRERGRCRTVRALDLTGGITVEPGLDRYVEQAVQAFAAPVALVSLIHDDEQRVVASRGFAPACLPREQGFCNHALDCDAVLEVCDPLHDARFSDLPAVTGEPRIRYYLGAPLHLAGGIDVGVLCVLDTRERPPASPDQRAYLQALARQVSMLLEQRLAATGSLAA